MKGKGILGRIFGRKKKDALKLIEGEVRVASKADDGGDEPLSPEGLVCVASTCEPDRRKLPESHDRFEAKPLTEERVSYKCGHEDFAKFKLDIYGEEVELKDKFWRERSECSACHIARMTSAVPRCALCGLPILPGQGVALYAYTRQFRRKPWVHRVGPEGESVLGCLRWDCCPSGAFFAGHWDGEKFVGAFDGMTVAEAVMSDGCARVVSDMRGSDEDKK